MNNKRWYLCGITSLFLFAVLALIIKRQALESPLPFVDPKLQTFAGHLQSNDFLLKLSTLIDHSLVPLSSLPTCWPYVSFFYERKNGAGMVGACPHALFNGSECL